MIRQLSGKQNQGRVLCSKGLMISIEGSEWHLSSEVEIWLPVPLRATGSLPVFHVWISTQFSSRISHLPWAGTQVECINDDVQFIGAAI